MNFGPFPLQTRTLAEVGLTLPPQPLPRGRPRTGVELPLPEVTLVEQPPQLEAECGRQLWCAVLAIALSDAQGVVVGNDSSGAPNRKRLMVAQAQSWFRNNGTDFRRVCWLAGFDPDVVRARALALFDGGAS